MVGPDGKVTRRKITDDQKNKINAYKKDYNDRNDVKEKAGVKVQQMKDGVTCKVDPKTGKTI